MGGARDPRPALGDSWRNQPHCRVQLSKLGGAAGDASGGQQCVATLKACPIAPCEEQAHYWLAEAGLVG